MIYVPRPDNDIDNAQAVVEAASNGYLRLIELVSEPDKGIFLIDQNVEDQLRLAKMNCDLICFKASRLRVKSGNRYELE